MVEPPARVRSDRPARLGQQMQRFQGQLGLTRRRVLQLVQRGRETTKVVHGFRRRCCQHLQFAGLPVRRHHQHGLDAGEALPQGTQIGAELPGLQGKGGGTMRNKEDRGALRIGVHVGFQSEARLKRLRVCENTGRDY